MIAFPNLSGVAALSAQPHKDAPLVRVMDILRDEAALELDAALSGVAGKRIDAAAVPGMSRTGFSRAANGSGSNPLYRIAAAFVLMKRLGLGRERAQRVVNWLQDIVDTIWDEEDVPPLKDVLDKEQELDGKDDGPQQRAYGGCTDSALEMLRVKESQVAHDRVVILALRREIAGRGAR